MKAVERAGARTGSEEKGVGGGWLIDDENWQLDLFSLAIR